MKHWKIANRLPVINPTLSQALHAKAIKVKDLAYVIELVCQRCHAPFSIEVLATPLPKRW
jgi:hypothetical protein